jgi:hypothetical protein
MRPRGAGSGEAGGQLALLALASGLTRPGLAARGALSGAGGVAELAEDLAQPVVHLLEDRGPVVEVDLVEVGQPLDGLVDPRVSGWGESWPSGFYVQFFPSPWLRITSAVSAVRYPPARNGTADRGARRT